MGAFADSIQHQAAQTLRTTFHQEAPHGTDAVLELMAMLLEDGSGGILPVPQAPITTEQWLTWNRLLTLHEQAVARMVRRELEREKPALPMDMEAMRTWAARLLLSTLDRLGML